MTLQELTHLILDFIKANQVWSAPIIFLFAFGESLAIISLFVPMTVLFAVGALIGADALPFFSTWVAAALGSALGDWTSYWLGKHYHQKIIRSWPLNKYPKLIYRSEQFFHRFGVASIALGRFFGPLRAIVPLIAGSMQMPSHKFNAANLISAPIWACLIFLPGMFGVQWAQAIFG